MPIKSFADVLRHASEAVGGSRPDHTSAGPLKTHYATHFSNAMAVFLANALRDRFSGIKPDPDGGQTEAPARSLRGLKKLDVNYSTAQTGLGLGISLKSVHTRDKNPRSRFHHNLKRNDEELRVEALGYHQRQPYSVLVAIVCLPIDACRDGDETRPSSFGKWVEYLWPLGNRQSPVGEFDTFERVFVAIYDPERSTVEFFDVKERPPKNGVPDTTISTEELARTLTEVYEKRNGLDFAWSG